MDEQELFEKLSRCKHLKYKFFGVFAADNFPVQLRKDSFVIINASCSYTAGSHWLLFLNRSGEHFFVDPLGESLEQYDIIYRRILKKHSSIIQIARGISIQHQSSNLCGLYCVHLAHLLFKGQKLEYVLVNDYQLRLFANHMC